MEREEKEVEERLGLQEELTGEERKERKVGRRGSKTLKRIKTFLRREKTYVVDGGSNSMKHCK